MLMLLFFSCSEMMSWLGGVALSISTNQSSISFSDSVHTVRCTMCTFLYITMSTLSIINLIDREVKFIIQRILEPARATFSEQIARSNIFCRPKVSEGATRVEATEILAIASSSHQIFASWPWRPQASYNSAPKNVVRWLSALCRGFGWSTSSCGKVGQITERCGPFTILGSCSYKIIAQNWGQHWIKWPSTLPKFCEEQVSYRGVQSAMICVLSCSLFLIRTPDLLEDEAENCKAEKQGSHLHHFGIAALWHWTQTYFPQRWKKRANFLWDNSRMVPLSPRSWIIWHIGAGLGVTMDGSAFYSFLLTFTQNVALQLHVLIIWASVNNQFSDQILLWL